MTFHQVSCHSFQFGNCIVIYFYDKMSDFVASDASVSGSVPETPVLDQIGNEMPVFGEQIDSSFFDEFNLLSILETRKALAADRPIQILASEKPSQQPSGVAKIANIEKALVFEEDAEDFARLEQHNIELAKAANCDGDGSEEGASLKSSTNAPPQQKAATQWAVNTIIKYEEFEKLRPNLALEYPFELDNFQKQGMYVY